MHTYSISKCNRRLWMKCRLKEIKNRNFVIYYKDISGTLCFCVKTYAAGRGRTGMILQSRVFETRASTNSATAACIKYYMKSGFCAIFTFLKID